MRILCLKNTIVALAFVTATAASASTHAWKGSIAIPKGSKHDYAKSAKITLVEAIEAALAKVPGKALEAELDRDNGYLIYEVKIQSDAGQVKALKVDAGDKSILQEKVDWD